MENCTQGFIPGLRGALSIHCMCVLDDVVDLRLGTSLVLLHCHAHAGHFVSVRILSLVKELSSQTATIRLD